MHEWLSDAVERVRKTSRGGALPDRGVSAEVSDEAMAVDKVAGKSLLLRSVTLIEYVLLISCVSLVICLAGPPVADAIQGQFGKVEEVISNGTSGGSGGGGGDFPGGGSGGGGENPDKPDGGDTGGTGGTDPEKPGGGNTGGDTGGDPKPEEKKLEGSVELSPAVVGKVATATANGAQNDAVPGYEWSIEGETVSTGATWVPSAEYAGKDVTVTAADTSGTYTGSISATTKVTQQKLDGTVSVTGAVAGGTASATFSPIPTDANIVISWNVDGAENACNGSSLNLADDSAGKVIEAVATDSNGIYAGSVSSGKITVAATEVTGTMDIPSPVVVGKPVTVSVSTQPSDVEMSYTWMVANKVVEGATGTSWTPRVGDEGKQLTVVARPVSPKYTGEIRGNAPIDQETLAGSISIDKAVAGLTSTATIQGAQVPVELTWKIDGAEVAKGTNTVNIPLNAGGKELTVEGVDTSGVYKGMIVAGPIVIGNQNISGNVKLPDNIEVGTEITPAINGLPEGAKPSYSWKVDGVEKGTEQSYTPTVDDGGKTIVLEIADKNGNYEGTISSNPVVIEKAKLTGSVNIGGTAQVGKTLSANVSGTQSDAVLGYQWYVSDGNAKQVFEGTIGAYVNDSDRGEISKQITCSRDTALLFGYVDSKLEDVTYGISIAVSDDGTGETVAEATLGTDGYATIFLRAGSYSIHMVNRDGVTQSVTAYTSTMSPISEATSESYTPVQGDAGKVVAVAVKDARGKYRGEIESEGVAIPVPRPLIGKVSFVDSVLVGQTANATISGTQSDADLLVQWLVDGEAVEGATGTSYTVRESDAGKKLSFKVSDVSGKYSGSLTSSEAAVVKLKIVTWADGTDEEVAAMVDAADKGLIKLTDYWKSGDTRTVKLSSMGTISGIRESHAAQSVEYVLSDPGHFTLANGKKCSFTVIQKDCLNEYGVMNTSRTNSGGWDKAPRRTWCNTTYRNALPAALKPIFKQFKVTTANGTGSGTTVSTDYFSLFSEMEVFGTTHFADSTAESANTQLDYFKTSGNRVKKANGSADWWWERSPGSGYSGRFCDVNSGGSADYDSADYSGGLAPFGCI